jgi:cAMP phosphodiesterase
MSRSVCWPSWTDESDGSLYKIEVVEPKMILEQVLEVLVWLKVQSGTKETCLRAMSSVI